MKADTLSKKSRAILRALAGGHSFEQILAANSKMNYHDIFRAAAQAPALLWDDKTLGATEGWPQSAPTPQNANLSAHPALRTLSD